MDSRTLVAHVVYRFTVGGLENGVVNLINHLSADKWRHAIVALTQVDPTFAARIHRPDITYFSLNKPPGQGVWQYPKLWRLFRQLRPAIVHTRNLAALEAQVPAWMAGVAGRVHGEHGRDAEDVHGTNRRHILMRKAYRPFVQQHIALGQELTTYMRERIGVPSASLHTIYNGVDPDRFAPDSGCPAIPGCPFEGSDLWIVGTVGRMHTVKAQPLLAHAFVAALQRAPALRRTLRLVMVGGGPLREECHAILQAAGVQDLAWLPGERSDVPDIMRGLHCFVLPSLAEGISNTILEAMSTALPVLATNVGANAELVEEGVTGYVVPAGNISAMSARLVSLACQPSSAAAMGLAGRRRVQREFSLRSMVAAYETIYQQALS